MFSPVYKELVLDKGYRNWVRLYLEEFWMVQRAHLVGLLEQKIVAKSTAREIGQAIDELQVSIKWTEHISEDIEDLYFSFEKMLASRVGSESAAFLHTARSRNDMDNTIFRLCLKKKIVSLAREILVALDNLINKAKVSSEELTILFTHGQPANVSTMGHYFSAFAGDLAQDLQAFLESIESVDKSSMGACAITGTGFPLNRERVADLLGFSGIVTNTYRAISSSHWLTRPAIALEELMRDYTRIAADILHKASSEVGLISFPSSLIQVSSIMPQKRNPVIIEHLRIQAGLAAMTSASIAGILNNVPYQDVNELSDAPVSTLIDSFDIAFSATELLNEALLGVKSEEQRVRQIALSFGVTTTELADTLVRREGIGFRDAHAICSVFVQAGYDLSALRTAFQSHCGREMTLSNSEINEALSPEGFVAVRKTTGGPSRDGMVPVFDELDSWKSQCTHKIEQIDIRDRNAHNELDRAWNRLLA